MQLNVLGGGAIGFALAAHLESAGRAVQVVRTRPGARAGDSQRVTVEASAGSISAAVAVSLLDDDAPLEGALIVTAKAFANARIAAALVRRGAGGPVVLLQNGIEVEAAFRDLPNPLYRCVLYATSQWQGERLRFRPVLPSPVGVVRGEAVELERLVAALHTAGFQFRGEDAIATQVWSKGIANSVFNTVCPLLEADNGIFARSPQARTLAERVIAECVPVAAAEGVSLDPVALLAKVVEISRGTEGQWISTLEDLRHGRPTEIGFLNLAIAALADRHGLGADVRLTRSLGELIALREAGGLAVAPE